MFFFTNVCLGVDIPCAASAALRHSGVSRPEARQPRHKEAAAGVAPVAHDTWHRSSGTLAASPAPIVFPRIRRTVLLNVASICPKKEIRSEEGSQSRSCSITNVRGSRVLAIFDARIAIGGCSFIPYKTRYLLSEKRLELPAHPPPPAAAMANIEKSSTDSSYPAALPKSSKQDEAGVILDERRRAALAEVDNADFSCVLLTQTIVPRANVSLTVGGT